MPGFYLGTHLHEKKREGTRKVGRAVQHRRAFLGEESRGRSGESNWSARQLQKTSAVRAVCSHQELA